MIQPIEKQKLHVNPKSISTERTPKNNDWKTFKIRTYYGKQQFDYQVFLFLFLLYIIEANISFQYSTSIFKKKYLRFRGEELYLF